MINSYVCSSHAAWQETQKGQGAFDRNKVIIVATLVDDQAVVERKNTDTIDSKGPLQPALSEQARCIATDRPGNRYFLAVNQFAGWRIRHFPQGAKARRKPLLNLAAALARTFHARIVQNGI